MRTFIDKTAQPRRLRVLVPDDYIEKVLRRVAANAKAARRAGRQRGQST